MSDLTTSYASIAQMAARVRQRSDHVNSTFVSDAEVEQYVKESYYELYDLLIESNGPEHFLASFSFTTAAGESVYPIVKAKPGGEGDAPIDLYKTIRLVISFDGGTTYDPVDRFPIYELDQRNQATGWGSPSGVRYNISTDLNNAGLYDNIQYRKLLFAPAPTGAFPGVLYYIPTPFVGDDPDNPNFILHYAHWDEYIVVDAAAKVLEKEESDASHLYRRKAELRQRIIWHANTMNHDDAGNVRDVYGGRSYDMRREPWS